MHAVIRTGGKQYRVAAGDVVKVERLAGEAGETVTFDEVLMVSDGEQSLVGSPLIDDVVVTGTVAEQARAPTILVFKKKRRKNYRRRNGHRQHVTVVRITDINLPGASDAAPLGGNALPQEATSPEVSPPAGESVDPSTGNAE